MTRTTVSRPTDARTLCRQHEVCRLVDERAHEHNPRAKVEIVDGKSQHLPQVKQLGRAHSKTLQMMPDGAFEEYAALKQMLGAVNDAGMELY